MLKKYLFIVFVFSFYLTNAQLTVNVDGLKESDSIVVIVKKGAEQLFKKYAKYSNGETASVDFTLDSGEWAVKLDATGYTYASQQVINIPSITSVSFTLTEATEGDYTYNWVDDGSAAGHSTQSYIAEPTEIIVLNDTVNVPTDFSSIKLRTEYGIVLSDSIKPWTNEDSYRLYKMFSNLPYDPFGEGNTVDFSTGENVRGVFMLTDLELSDDITINNSGEIPYATVSQSAFTYANPQIVKLDGIRGKFYSKRLYHVIVNYIKFSTSINSIQSISWLFNITVYIILLIITHNYRVWESIS